MKNVVVVGAGHGGVQMADSLRAEGYDGDIVLISAEQEAPYQRPPLSKDFLIGTHPEVLPLRGEKFFTEQRISLRLGACVTAINPQARSVTLGSEEVIPYDELVLATGSSNRRLKVEDGAQTSTIFDLRTAADARAIRKQLSKIRHAVVVGAGFVGMEFAAVASQAGVAVTVLECADREMARVLSPAMSQIFFDKHLAMGIKFRFGEGASHVSVGPDCACEVHTTSGDVLSADMVLCSIGAVPNTELAELAGVQVNNGFVVNRQLQTSVPHIWAIGDCVRFPSPFSEDLIRLESVQNAVDQARHLARVLMGENTAYSEVPWFWTIQADYKLQIAGIYMPGDVAVAHNYGPGKCSIFCFRNSKLVAVESLNRPSDHVAARRILASHAAPSIYQVKEKGFDLKAHLKSVA